MAGIGSAHNLAVNVLSIWDAITKYKLDILEVKCLEPEVLVTGCFESLEYLHRLYQFSMCINQCLPREAGLI